MPKSSKLISHFEPLWMNSRPGHLSSLTGLAQNSGKHRWVGDEGRQARTSRGEG
jgi:hypothetical protein